MASENPCGGCDGKCCRYFALEIDEPTTEEEFENVRWYLCHEGTKVYVEEGVWYLEVQNVCRHLDERNLCRIYPERPAICREHSVENCEFTDCEFDRELEFDDDAAFARYVKKRRRKEKKARKKEKAKRRMKAKKRRKKGKKGKKRGKEKS